MIGAPKLSPPNGVAAATRRRFWEGGFWEAVNDTSGTAGAAYGYDGSAVSFDTNWLHPSRLSARSALWLGFNAARRHPHKHRGDAEPDPRGLARRMTDHCRPCGPARRERGGGGTLAVGVVARARHHCVHPEVFAPVATSLLSDDIACVSKRHRQSGRLVGSL
jgi:hypothetical protein